MFQVIKYILNKEDALEKRYASGAIVFRREEGQILFLLIYSVRNAIWGFPKGHIDPGEDEMTAAFREIEEETGLTGLKVRDDFREEAVYEAPSSREADKGKLIEKHSIYYLCETTEDNIRVDGEEITDHRWVKAEEALPLLVFDNLKAILKKASEKILDKTAGLC